MLNRGSVITNAFTLWKETGAMVGRFETELKPYGIKIDHLANSSPVTFVDSNGAVKVNIPSYDFMTNFDKDCYVSSLLEKAGFHLFNSSEVIHIHDDKMLIHVVSAGRGITLPKTISCPHQSDNGDNRGKELGQTGEMD